MKNLFVLIIMMQGAFLCHTGATAQQANRLFFQDQSDLKEISGPRFIEGIEIRGGENQNFSSAQPVTASLYTAGTVKPILSDKGTTAIESAQSLQFKYAIILDREVEKISNLSLFAFIDEWWGTRYRYGGTTKKGIDCSALTSFLYRDVYGNNLPRTARMQYQVCQKIHISESVEGDLLFFNTRGGISHVAVYLGDGYFVHSSTNQGVVISHINDPYYQKRFLGAGRPMPETESFQDVLKCEE